MVDEQKLRELAQDIVVLMENKVLDLDDVGDASAAILSLLDELKTLREERTAWRVTAENAEAAVKQARIDALDLAMEMCRNMVAPNLASNTAPYSAYEAACIDCESAIESLKGTP